MYANVVALAAEFPNDNPALHRGTIWVCAEVTGPLSGERTLLLDSWDEVGDLAGDGAIVVEDIDPIEASFDADAIESVLPPPDLAGGPPAAVAMTESEPIVAEAEPVMTEPEPIMAKPEPMERIAAEPEPIVADPEPIMAEPEPVPVVAEAVAASEPVREVTAPVIAPSLAPITVVGDALAMAETVRSPERVAEPVPEEPAVNKVAGERESGIFAAAIATEEPDVPPADVIAAEPPTVTFDEIPAAPPALTSTGLPPAPDDPFTVLVCTLADVAISAGSPHVASLLPGLFFDGRIEGPLDPEVGATLTASGILEGNAVSASFLGTAAAWKAILRGTSDDFDACGAAMLDEWAADILAKLLREPTRMPSLRQDLRSRGVAAFGLIEQAAA